MCWNLSPLHLNPACPPPWRPTSAVYQRQQRPRTLKRKARVGVGVAAVAGVPLASGTASSGVQGEGWNSEGLAPERRHTGGTTRMTISFQESEEGLRLPSHNSQNLKMCLQWGHKRRRWGGRGAQHASWAGPPEVSSCQVSTGTRVTSTGGMEATGTKFIAGVRLCPPEDPWPVPSPAQASKMMTAHPAQLSPCDTTSARKATSCKNRKPLPQWLLHPGTSSLPRVPR